jgi:hypothetical protein
MFPLTTTGRSLSLLILAFGLSLSVQAQKDCVYGFKIYARDEAGKTIENAKVEVSGLRSGKKLHRPFDIYFADGFFFVGASESDATLPGDYLLRISAEGFETYERRLKFPVCEIQSYELRLTAKGSSARTAFERLFTVHGKVFDEDRRPFSNAKIEARSADGRTFKASSNAYGYFELNVPRGMTTVRVSDEKIADVVFENYQVLKNYSVLNVAVCLKCKQKQSEN